MALKKQITEREKMELLGLIVLGQQQYRKVDAVYTSLTNVLGEDGTHLHDAVYEIEQEIDIDNLLKKAGIEVIGNK